MILQYDNYNLLDVWWKRKHLKALDIHSAAQTRCQILCQSRGRFCHRLAKSFLRHPVFFHLRRCHLHNPKAEKNILNISKCFDVVYKQECLCFHEMVFPLHPVISPVLPKKDVRRGQLTQMGGQLPKLWANIPVITCSILVMVYKMLSSLCFSRFT